jgi:hypothetical protein
MRVRVGCEFQSESQHPVTTVMLLGPRTDGAHRTIYESRWAEPVLPIRDFRDAFAKRGSFRGNAELLSVTVEAYRAD